MTAPTDASPLLALPAPSRRRLAIHVTPAAERALRAGSSWVFADAIARTSFEGAPGDLAVVFDGKERFVAVGLYDPDSDLAFRSLATAPTTIDAPFLAARLDAANALRSAIAAQHTGYRVVFGEADRLPGLVVDRYAGTLCVKLYTAAWVPWLRIVIDALRALLAPERVVLRLPRIVAARPARLHGLYDGATLVGTAPTTPIDFTEHGLVFAADVVHGQKTGFFLDQRDNRARVEALAAGRRVLNVCAYTGGFSLYAARGGASEVVSLDVSAPALRDAEANFARNAHDARIAACRHTTLCGDAFELMPQLAAEGRRFDLVVLDPPSFAKKRSEVDGALVAYARLARLGLALLSPGGVLVACSCSSRVSAEQFFAAVQDGARAARRTLRVLETTGHPIDHPNSRELNYLKALFGRIE